MKKFHFIGICGSSMSALAVYLKHSGNYVQGSDISNFEMMQKLKNEGIVVFCEHNKDNIKNGFEVIYNFAIPCNNIELIEAKKLGLCIKSRAELLCDIANEFENVIAITGSHGKTTTTAMIYSCLSLANKNPTLHIGGELVDRDFGIVLGCKKYFVCEACEYHDSFLKLKPNIGVILNIEPEHLDYFKNFNNEVSSFNCFANSCHKAIVFDDKLIKGKNILTFGTNKSNIYAKNISYLNGRYEYDCYINKKYCMHIRVGAVGKYNVMNSLAVIATCKLLGIENKYIQQGIENYVGVKRRYEIIASSPYIVHDYAHHPTEICNTIKTFVEHTTKKKFIIFQPHTYSRTKTLFNDFMKCFCGDFDVMFLKTYSAREKYDNKASSYFLYKQYKKIKSNCLYCAKFDVAIKKIIKKIQQDYSVLILGAGDIVNIAYKLKNIFSKTNKQ